MRIIRTKYLPPKNYDAINILGFLFVHPEVKLTKELINHEKIHTHQMIEMLVLPFYLWYFIEWLIRIPLPGRAYMNLSFEREAYSNMNNLHYLETRKPYAWLKYLKSRQLIKFYLLFCSLKTSIIRPISNLILKESVRVIFVIEYYHFPYL